MTIICIVVFIIALFCGSVKTASSLVIVGIRLPRILGAGLAGIGLSVSGFLLQTVSGNALCAPNILGINAGAGLGIVILLCMVPGSWRFTPLAAFVGASIAILIVLSVAKKAGRELSKGTLILSGIAVGAFGNAGISLLILRFPDVASDYNSFTSGGFKGVQLDNILIPSIIVLICIVISMLISGRIKLLLLGDGIASSLGINVQTIRMIVVLLASAMSASIISYAGLLSFVGLIIPHISRIIFGNDVLINIISCSEIGFAMVIAADLLGRVILAPSEIPAGIITSIMGAPFFVYLIIKNDKF